MSKFFKIGLAVLTFLIIVSNTLFSVDQRRFAVIFQFDKAVRTIDTPGLNWKIPLLQNVVFYEKRIMQVNVETKELTALDGKRLIVDAFVKFKIESPVTFFRTVRDHNGVKIRLNRILESAMRKVIGEIKLSDLLTKRRSDIMRDIYQKVINESKIFGIKIIDVRLLRTDLPTENSEAIYRRMQTSREKEAKQIRAEGEEQAQKIRSRADKEQQIILAKAYRDSEIIMGEGDAIAARTYNRAYSSSPDFYKFYRSMIAYENSLDQGNTSFVINSDSEFFDYMKLKKSK